MKEQAQRVEDSLEISQVFLQQKKLILIVSIITIVLWGLFIYKQKPVYEARVLLSPLSKVNTTVINVNPLFYLQMGSEVDLTLTDLNTIFSTFLKVPLWRALYYNQRNSLSYSTKDIYHNSLDITFKLLAEWGKYYNVQLDSSNKTTKYVITAVSSDSQTAKKNLQQFIAYLNKNANKQLALIIENHKKALFDPSHRHFAPVKDDSHRYFLNSASSLSSILLLELYKLNNSFDNQYFTGSPVINLYKYYSPITITSTALDSKPQIIIILGLLGGILLGFFAAIFSISIKRSFNTPNIRFQIL